MRVFVVTDDDGTIVTTYTIEGHARRFCKDNGYSYTEYIDSDYVADLQSNLLIMMAKYTHLMELVKKEVFGNDQIYNIPANTFFANTKDEANIEAYRSYRGWNR